MFKSLSVILIALASLCLNAWATPALPTAFPVLSADFKQVRTIEGLPQPIISTGHMIISDKHGLYWEQQTPFMLSILFTPTHMVQQIEHGQKEVITAKNNPMLFQFNQLLSALFTMDPKVIEQYFTVTERTEKKGLQTLVLTPKTAPFNQIFRTITLVHDQFIREVALKDQQNDVTHLYFTHHATADALSDFDAKRFNP
ncbi:LolA family protein [Wohlfahrtiimonas chitiniclastica]|uniref:LolA family protein n=1 Tax=Wohlfahrtiimonas chitiniclastica TaxID=400946 RepID=UPI000B98093C|nr:outer membrane lipoprotein carrier protein LolA [Wohlfahrtiimonas chitiniclastica]OYQ83827.1 hypothetical protein B9T14_06300 [Wohlfahrtiimonas chitiniclastica]OYQ84666.1 hypothetical protein B9T15_06330 [Wohlfahrtiimonas chitiniclastica]